MNYLDLISQTIALLAPLTPQWQDLPPDIAHVSRAEQQGELSLTNQFLTVPGIGELRSVSVISAKVAIVNIFFFPEADQQLPVYAVEFVSLSARPIVAVIDARCLLTADCEKQVTLLLQQARSGLYYLSPETEMPEWYLAARSGDDIFVRTPTVAQMTDLMALHLQIWQALMPVLSNPQRYTPEKSRLHAQKLQDYKDQHRLNSPGIPLLNRSFGQQWTQHYLKNYLFA